MKKQIIIVLSIGIMAVLLVGCGNKTTKVNLGQGQNLGKQELSVVGYTTSNSIEDSFERYTADGKFVVIEVKSKNISDEAIDIGTDFLLKANGKTYSESTMVALAANENVTNNLDENKNKQNFVVNLGGFNPGFTKNTYIVFDVPKDVDLTNAYLINTNSKNVEFKINKN